MEALNSSRLFNEKEFPGSNQTVREFSFLAVVRLSSYADHHVWPFRKKNKLFGFNKFRGIYYPLNLYKL